MRRKGERKNETIRRGTGGTADTDSAEQLPSRGMRKVGGDQRKLVMKYMAGLAAFPMLVMVVLGSIVFGMIFSLFLAVAAINFNAAQHPLQYASLYHLSSCAGHCLPQFQSTQGRGNPL